MHLIIFIIFLSIHFTDVISQNKDFYITSFQLEKVPKGFKYTDFILFDASNSLLFGDFCVLEANL